MAQVMVNFRMDETVKKSMERACKEMGLSMTTAFTIFATKVGKEKRIPFEITAEPSGASPHPQQYGEEQDREETSALARRQEEIESLCTEIRRALTAIHTAVPASITGLSIEHIRQLCGGGLKEQNAEVLKESRTLFSGRNAGMLLEKDLDILDEYMDGLSSIAGEIREIKHTLIPAMKAWPGEDRDGFTLYEGRLEALSWDFEELRSLMQRFLRSTAQRPGSAGVVRARVRQAAEEVETAYVRSALDSLEALVLRNYDALDAQTKARLESHYLQTLELTLRELGQSEQNGGDTSGKAALCLRAINVLTQVISGGSQAQQEQDGRRLEAEVAALESLAALRGDIMGPLKPET